jgi:D-tyrosyl-tRNA(Tyr) deacylase
MRAVVQRVSEASVEVDGEVTGAIGKGFMVLLGVSGDDTEQDAEWLAEKIVNLRVFEDDQGKLNRSLLDAKGEMLVVSQFTLLGDCRKGRRPSFSHAAPPDKANDLYMKFTEKVSALGVRTATGRFQAMMDVKLVNQGPVTLLLDSGKTF